MGDWPTGPEVLKRMRLRPQTLYSYVSRGQIQANPDEADPRHAVDLITGQRPNIDFAPTALVDLLGPPHDSTFQIFAIARCTGWIAHALEQVQKGRLIRPRARYVGPALKLSEDQGVQ